MVPAAHSNGTLQHAPATAQAAFVAEHEAVVPPFEPAHDQVRVVPQAVAPLSLFTVPALQVPAEPHIPFVAYAVLHTVAFSVALTVPAVDQAIGVVWKLLLASKYP